MSRRSVDGSTSPEQGFFRKLSVALLGDDSPPPVLRAAAERAGAGTGTGDGDGEGDGGGLWKRMSTALTDAFADDSGEDTPNAAADAGHGAARQSSGIFDFFGDGGGNRRNPSRSEPGVCILEPYTELISNCANFEKSETMLTTTFT